MGDREKRFGSRRLRLLGVVLLLGGIALVLVARLGGLSGGGEFSSVADVGSGPLQVPGLVMAFVGAFLAASPVVPDGTGVLAHPGGGR